MPLRLISLLMLLLSSSAMAQPFYPDEYETYPERDKKLVFFEDFADDHNGWIGNPTSLAQIAGGIFTIYETSVDTSWYIELPYDLDRDFELEFSAAVRGKTSSENAAYIGWGEATPRIEVGTYFLIQPSGRVRLATPEKGTYRSTYNICDWDKKQEYHQYTIRKVRGAYYVFVDGVFMLDHPYTKVEKGLLCAGVFNTSLQIDWLKLHYLSKPIANTERPRYKRYSWELNREIHGINITKRMREECLGNFLFKVLIDEKGRLDSFVSYSTNAAVNKQLKHAMERTSGEWTPAYRNDTPYKAWFVAACELRTGLKLMSCPDMDFYFKKGLQHYKASVENPGVNYTNNIEQAIFNFKAAASIDFHNIDALYNIAVIYINEKQYENACEYLQLAKEAKRLSPGAASKVNDAAMSKQIDQYQSMHCNPKR